MRIKGTVPQRQLARTLRRLREEAGLTLEETAPKLDWSTSKLSRIETAQQGVDVHGVRSMLDLYNVGGAQWAEIIEMVRDAKQKTRRPPRPRRTATPARPHHPAHLLPRGQLRTRRPRLERSAGGVVCWSACRR